jgi:hypothetical protein
MFQDKRYFKPLQAADILAWQAQNHMRRTVLIGRDPNDEKLVHHGYRVLRDKRPMATLFFSREQMKYAFDGAKDYHRHHGLWPWQPEAKANLRVLETAPGKI